MKSWPSRLTWLLAAIVTLSISVTGGIAEPQVPAALYRAPNAELRGTGSVLPNVPWSSRPDLAALGVTLTRIDSGKSLLITDPAWLKDLTATAVFTQLAKARGSDGAALFSQMMESLAQGDAPVDAAQAPCLDKRRPGLVANDFTVLCDMGLAALGTLKHPLTNGAAESFRIVAAVNRIDLNDNGTCGEFRLVLAADHAWPAMTENGTEDLLINIEPAFRYGNRPERCFAVQLFWARLSMMTDAKEAATALRRFFLDGGTLSRSGELSDGEGCTIDCFEPLISADAMRFPQPGDAALCGAAPCGGGQIRTNSQTRDHVWTFREFKFDKQGDLLPVPLANTPDYSTVRTGSPHAAAMAKAIAAQNATLSSALFENLSFESPVGTYANQQRIMPTGDTTAFESLTPPPCWDTARNPNYAAPNCMDETLALAFKTREDAALSKPNALKRRFVLLSCAGCHNLINSQTEVAFDDMPRWPGSLGFTHIDYDDMGKGTRLSKALCQVFLPYRQRRMEAMLGLAPADPIPPAPCTEDKG